jgi:hypothetical protein
MLFLVAISDSVSNKVISTPPTYFKNEQALKDTERAAKRPLFIGLPLSLTRHPRSNRHVSTHRQFLGAALTEVVKSS